MREKPVSARVSVAFAACVLLAGLSASAAAQNAERASSVGGGGIVFPRTSLTVSGWSLGRSGDKIPSGPLAYESPSKGARPALTLGADISVPLHQHLDLCGVVCLHHLWRAAPLRSAPFGNANDERPFLQPGANVIRLGVGVRVIL